MLLVLGLEQSIKGVELHTCREACLLLVLNYQLMASVMFYLHGAYSYSTATMLS